MTANPHLHVARSSAMRPLMPGNGSVRAALSAAQPAGARPLRWSRVIVEAVRRVDEYVVRYLGVARCGLWTVGSDIECATCVDMFASDLGVHRREPDRLGAQVAALHRRLDADGSLALLADGADAGLLPPGTSASLAVALRRGGRLVAYLCAERADEPTGWTEDHRRFMQSMSDVVREVFALAAGAHPADDDSLLDRLAVVAYRGTRLGDEWTLTSVSDAAERVLGRRAAELIGQPVDALRRLLDHAPPALPDNGEFEHGYRVQRRPDAPARRFNERGRVGTDAVSGAPLIEGLVSEIGVDVAGERGAQFELLSHISHELRTPLNAILGFAQLIELDPASSGAQRHEYLSQIQRAGRHLLDVIRETMDLTRLHAGPIELQIDAVPLASLVAECVPMVANQASQGGVRLVNAVRDRTLRVRADARRLNQALVNLLSNAVKYNRSGGSVYVECMTHGDAVRLRVTDTGIGLAAHQTEALFQPFNRLGMERSEIEGVGLGLVITRRLIEAMGGEISVTSQPGIGSTFELTLPRHREA